MCILITKEKGVRYPSTQTIVNCMDSNPDGFAMAYSYKGRLMTYKTLDRDEFISEYEKVTTRCNPSDVAMIIHCRIATHGSVSVDNCHCWTGRILGCRMAFAHNGILPIEAQNDMTDSETFLRKYLQHSKTLTHFLKTVNKFIGNSKLAFLDSDGNILRFGMFITDFGAQYSNDSFRRAHAVHADLRLWRSYAF